MFTGNLPHPTTGAPIPALFKWLQDSQNIECGHCELQSCQTWQLRLYKKEELNKNFFEGYEYFIAADCKKYQKFVLFKRQQINVRSMGIHSYLVEMFHLPNNWTPTYLRSEVQAP